VQTAACEIGGGEMLPVQRTRFLLFTCQLSSLKRCYAREVTQIAVCCWFSMGDNNEPNVTGGEEACRLQLSTQDQAKGDAALYPGCLPYLVFVRWDKSSTVVGRSHVICEQYSLCSSCQGYPLFELQVRVKVC
jgi:hypothetical protein